MEGWCTASASGRMLAWRVIQPAWADAALPAARITPTRDKAMEPLARDHQSPPLCAAPLHKHPRQEVVVSHCPVVLLSERYDDLLMRQIVSVRKEM